MARTPGRNVVICLVMLVTRLSLVDASRAFLESNFQSAGTQHRSLGCTPQRSRKLHTNYENEHTYNFRAATNSINHNDRVIIIDQSSQHPLLFKVRGGGGFIPGGWNPFGYKITPLGEEFLKFDGSLDSDVGRFMASLKSSRKTKATIKDNWLEIVRVSKTGQSMRIYRLLDELIQFCLNAGLID